MYYINTNIFPDLGTGIALSQGESAFPFLWNGLVGYWSPELGKQGAKLYDFSNYKRHATLTNFTPSTDYLAGKFGYTVSATASPNTKMDAGTIPQLYDATKDMSFIWLMKSTASSTNAMISFENNDVYQPATDFYTYGPANMHIGGLGDSTEYTSGIVLNDGKWHVVAVVLRRGTLAAYKDGVQQYSTAVAHNHANYGASHLLRFGAAGNITGYAGQFGFIAAYNRALSDAEIRLYSAGGSPLTAFWSVLGKSPITNQTVTPTLITSTATVQAPTIISSCTFEPTLITASAAVQSPVVFGGVIVEPSVILSPAAIQALAFIISSTTTPSTVTSGSSVQAPSFPGLSTIRNATKILSFNPLVVVTSNSPLKLARIDTTIPSAPVSTVYTIVGASNAQDIVFDSIFNKVFITCASGKIVELDGSDFSTYTIYDTGVTNQLQHIGSLPGYQMIFASSNYSLGEVLVMDSSVKTIVSTDIRFLSLNKKFLNAHINTVNAETLDTDIRFLELVSNLVNVDIRFTDIAPGEPEAPISRLDFHVFLDNVELTDVKMDSIAITHVEFEKSRATCILSRQHDNLDKTLEGVDSQITNQNALRVEINGHIEFNGFIWDINAQSENELVSLTAYTDVPKVDERSSVTLSLPSINERLSLHHALVHNPKIENPKIINEVNPQLYKGIFIDAGFYEEHNITRWTNLQDINDIAASVTDGTFIPKQNWAYFWFAIATNFITGKTWWDTRYIGTSPTGLTGDTWDVTGLAYKYQRIFAAKKQQLGTPFNIEASPTQFLEFSWGAGAVVFPINPIKINGVLTTTETRYGYSLGSSPFKEVSTKSGVLTTKETWIDKPDGLYTHKDESYDYRAYAQKILALEYKKIQNINGSVLPKTSADVEIFIDAYYTYGISLLKRINIDNTTKPNIYNKQNGFPLEVKSIDINSASMKVTLRCDNQWSKTEMVEIEASYPDSSDALYLFPAYDKKEFNKFNPATFENVE